MNTGFSWVRIDKGNIHCNFRYLNLEQVQTVVNYLLSYYEYRNISVNIVDLGAEGVLKESGDHYRPRPDDPLQDFYYLVELHRHGVIIPQGSVEVMKVALNALAQRAIIPESVFINKLKNNQLVVGDEETLTVTSTKSTANDVTWESSDLTILSITPDGMNCDIVAESPGTADIIASIQVPEAAPQELNVMPIPSYLWLGNKYKYVGNTVSYKFDGSKYYTDLSVSGTNIILVTYTQDKYYECYFDNTAPKKYIWREIEYTPGSPVMITYRDMYSLIVRTYIKILTKDVQRLCLHHFEQLEAYTPSTGLTINWSTSADNIGFDGGISTGAQVMVEGMRVGTSSVKASITDAYGSYSDSFPITVYALDATPSTIKMVVGATKSAVVAKKDIFSIESPVVVDWVTANSAIASVEPIEPVDPVTNFAEVSISAQGVGQTFVTAIAEDPSDGMSYSDTVKVTVGNVAINVPASNVINLLSSTTLTLTCDLTPGFNVAAEGGWVSGNPGVVSVTTVSGEGNNTVVLTGEAVGTSLITVTARNAAAVDTDQIVIRVVDAPVVTSGEMATFTHGMYNGHGVIDWDHPTGEEGTLEVDGEGLDLATEDEVEEFVDELFEEETDSDDSGHIE